MLNKLFSTLGMLFTGLVLCCRLSNFAQSEELEELLMCIFGF